MIGTHVHMGTARFSWRAEKNDFVQSTESHGPGWNRRQGARPSHFLPSPLIWYRVYVLISLALGEYGAVDRSTDPKGKLQLTVFQCGSRQPGNGVGEEALLSCNLRQSSIVQLVRA